MAQEKPHRPRSLDEPLLDLDLPPLASDEVDEVEHDVLAELVDTDYENDSVEGHTDILEHDHSAFLGDFETSSWVEDGSDDGTPDVAVSVDIDESDWASTEGDESDTEVADWFIPDYEEGETEIDDGEEGPRYRETYEIEESNWADLDGEDDDEEEDILETMDRLGMMDEMFPEAKDEKGYDAPSHLAEVSFIGPETGEASAAIFLGQSPVAAGDTTYVLGADNMLHATRSVRSDDLGAISMALDGDRLFIGTRRSGVYLSEDRGATRVPINGWYTKGLKNSALPPDDISTPFEMGGQQISGGYRLCGCTGKGQLFWSLDHGSSWHGPVWRGRCLAFAPIHRTDALLGLFQSPTKAVTLAIAEDLTHWRPLDVPVDLLAQLTQGSAGLAGCDSTVIAGGIGSRGELYRSLDRGETWGAVSGVGGVSAMAVDPEDPSWMAVGTWDGERQQASVRVSADSGETWQTVLLVNPVNRRGRTTDHFERVTGLAVSGAGSRQLMAITGRGVYLVKFSDGGFTH